MSRLEPETEAGTIAALAVAAQSAHVIDFADHTGTVRKFLVVPDGFRTEDVTDEHGLPVTLPNHVKESVVLQTVDSLVDYVQRFRTRSTILFADIDHNSIAARLDYHHTPADAQQEHAAAEFNAHVASMVLPYSVEWKTWAEIDKKLMGQLAFARFLEENGGDIVAPDGAELLEVCRDLQAVRNVDFKKAVRTASNNENFEFVDETNLRSRDTGIEIPSRFLLKIPVYFGQPATDLFAFLRWELPPGGGELKLGVQLHRPEHVRQAVFKQIVLDAAERTDRPAVFGRPGSR